MDSRSSPDDDDDDLPIFTGAEDYYQGFIVDPTDLPALPSHFIQRLQKSLDHWKAKSFRGIWLKLPIKNSNLVHPAVEKGFIYHHAEPDFIMLTYWIPEIPSTLPPNASHQVGVGAVVINDKDEILVVQERTGPMKDTGLWKVPTGLVHMGEDLKDGIVREVEEETAIQTDFVEVLGFRQAHGVAFGKSDLFFLCFLKPLSSEIVVQETEIAAAKWMHLDEFKHRSSLAGSDLLKTFVDIIAARRKDRYRGFGPKFLSHNFRRQVACFYHNIRDIDKFLASEAHSRV